MCFFYALSRDAQSLVNRYQLNLDFEFELAPELGQPRYYVSGFDFPRLPVISGAEPDRIQGMSWGLIPFWVKSREQAQTIRMNTLNARSDTVFEKPSFRGPIRYRRCLVPADGFYEWRLFRGKKYPYFIYRQDRTIFSMAGIWDEWTDRQTGEILRSYAIVTTDANPLLAKIHNTKLRMPLILPQELEREWLRNDLRQEEIVAMLRPLAEGVLTAHPIGKLITARNVDRNVPEIQEAWEYGVGLD